MEEKINFEENLKKLEEIVSKIQNGELTLDESTKLFSEGKAIVKQLEEQLSKVEKEVSEILK